jgi:hypothetical protein
MRIFHQDLTGTTLDGMKIISVWSAAGLREHARSTREYPGGVRQFCVGVREKGMAGGEGSPTSRAIRRYRASVARAGAQFGAVLAAVIVERRILAIASRAPTRWLRVSNEGCRPTSCYSTFTVGKPCHVQTVTLSGCLRIKDSNSVEMQRQHPVCN